MTLGKLILWYIVNSDIRLRLTKKEQGICIEFKFNELMQVEAVVQKRHEFYKSTGKVILPTVNTSITYDTEDKTVYVQSIDENTLRFFTTESDSAKAKATVLDTIRNQHKRESENYIHNKTSDNANKVNTLSRLYNSLQKA